MPEEKNTPTWIFFDFFADSIDAEKSSDFFNGFADEVRLSLSLPQNIQPPFRTQLSETMDNGAFRINFGNFRLSVWDFYMALPKMVTEKHFWLSSWLSDISAVSMKISWNFQPTLLKRFIQRVFTPNSRTNFMPIRDNTDDSKNEVHYSVIMTESHAFSLETSKNFWYMLPSRRLQDRRIEQKTRQQNMQQGFSQWRLTSKRKEVHLEIRYGYSSRIE